MSTYLCAMVKASLRLKPGVSPKQAVGQLRPLATEAGNVLARGGGVGGVAELRDAYLMWVESVEAQVRSLAMGSDELSVLHSQRYWQIRGLRDDAPRPWALVQAEVEMQRDWLELLVADLDWRMRRAVAAPGHPVVLDTNVLLHFEPPAMVPWCELLKQDAVRLVVPLRVVEELDEKKYARRGDLAGRARRFLPQLEKLLGPAGEPGDVRDGVTIEVPLDEARARHDDADEEILASVQELTQFGGQRATLVTSDTAMRIRAQAQGVTVFRLPSAYERRQEHAGAGE
jgi:rRNA-processing protein FCF1